MSGATLERESVAEAKSGLRRIDVADSTSLVDYASRRLRMLCSAAQFGDETESVVATFRNLILPWSDRDLAAPWSWTSEISDDNTPIEFSVAISEGTSDVRVLFEAQGDEPTLESFRRAGLVLHDKLEREHGASLERFRALKDLFLPREMAGPFAVWNSVVFSRGKAPSFKTYFNPQACGATRASSVVEEGLCRLGLGRAWGILSRTIAQRGPNLDEIKYFALDLSSDKEARVKVYVRHHSVTPEDLEYACSGARSYAPGEGLAFARAMRGGPEPLVVRGAFTCSAFEGDDERPAATTLYVPVCAYALDDSIVSRRVNDYLREHGADPRVYNDVIAGFANRPLESGVGMQSWVALRRQAGKPRLTVYLATEARHVHAPGEVPAGTGDRMSFESAAGVIHRIDQFDLSSHPFFCRLDREPDAGGPLWLFLRITWEGTTKNYAEWLRAVAARATDDRIKGVLAKKLEEELGSGEAVQAHSARTARFLDAIEPLRPSGVTDDAIVIGNYLGARLAKHYLSGDPFEGLGAFMAGEVCAAQLARAAVRLLAKQPRSFDEGTLEWLARHEDVARARAEESRALAHLLSNDVRAIESVRAGAVGGHLALWQSLDDLYELCFGDPCQSMTSSANLRQAGETSAG